MPRITQDKPLGGRYKLVSQLGVGGFGRTFLAEDLHLPGHPRCVIKHLRPQSKNDDTLQMARRCFNLEAQVLYRLGNHDQIPRLLAHFEEGQEFYLAQEFIEGEPLTRELVDGKPWSQGRAVTLTKDILQVLTFVHQQQVIHRDLKPSNLIRRRHDHKVVLIDFGAVKQVSAPSADPDTGLTNLTISIGTQGYMPNEQLAGRPKFCSDVYAVGILTVQMLTGLHPRCLGEDSNGEIAWHDHVNHVSPELIEVIDQMIRYDFRERYVDAAEALAALESLPAAIAEDQTEYEPPRSAKAAMGGAETANQVATTPQIETATDFSGQWSKSNFEFSNGRNAAPPEEPISTAIWLPNESTLQAMQASGTGLTQAVGRPHFSGANSATARRPALSGITQRLVQPWALVGLLGLGLTLALAQSLLPQLGNPFLGQHSSSSRQDATGQNSPLPDDPQQAASALVEQANRLLQEKQYDKAIAIFDQAIKLQSNYAPAYAGRCEALNLLERPEEAIVFCNDALAYDSTYAEAKWSQGNAKLLQNRSYEALKLYEEVTEAKPEFALGWVKRGVALQKLGRSAEALIALDQGIQLERNSAEAWLTKAEALYNLQRYDEALAAVNKALQLAPSNPQALELRQQAKDRASK
ncbi:MAG: protein kinase domain-containing protein [Leptolyngbya sp. IPPAS B-1204]|nr:MAG: tetratricopeptide repeat protein [Leptolyngbya sp. IPPAS B-1204]